VCMFFSRIVGAYGMTLEEHTVIVKCPRGRILDCDLGTIVIRKEVFLEKQENYLGS